MINVTDITKELHSIFIASVGAKDFKAIERGNIPNRDMSYTPWLGIYRRKVSYDPHSIGNNRSWKAEVELGLLLQVSSFEDGEASEDVLEEQLQKVQTILLANKKINGKVDQLIGMSVEYFFNDDEDESFTYQQAEVVITYEVRTQ